MSQEPEPNQSEPLSWAEFRRVDLRVGTIRTATPNPKARVPALVLEIDLGELGVQKSSAQLTKNYEPSELVGRQVVCVVNFPPKRIAGIKSEVLILGGLDPDLGTILLGIERPVAPGTAIA